VTLPRETRTPPDSALPVSVVTLGCPKNLVDSELLLGHLHRAGFRASRPEEAVLIVVNTCAFLTASQQESIETILEMARLKETGSLRSLVVAGCLPQRHGASVLEELPEVDYLLGPGTIDQVVEVARGLLAGDLRRGARLGGLDRAEVEWEPRVLSGYRHTAYLKLSEGCNNTCSFCIIPKLRGRHRSRPEAEIEAEARRLAEAGVKELTLVAQDTTSYGLDLHATGPMRSSGVSGGWRSSCPTWTSPSSTRPIRSSRACAAERAGSGRRRSCAGCGHGLLGWSCGARS
jgi:ribosomal protein S12 methylthiotransferase